MIQIVRQQEDHVARMENAGVELSMLVESGQLKLAFPRVPASPTVASAAPTSATSSGSSSTATTRNEPSLAADSEQAAKQSAAPKQHSVPKVTMVSAMSKLHSKAIADELDENLSAGWIAAGIPPTALENPILKRRSSWSLGRHAPHMCTPQSLASRTHTAAVRRTRSLSFICMKIYRCVLAGPYGARWLDASTSPRFRARSAIVLSKREPAGLRTCTGHCATRRG